MVHCALVILFIFSEVIWVTGKPNVNFLIFISRPFIFTPTSSAADNRQKIKQDFESFNRETVALNVSGYIANCIVPCMVFPPLAKEHRAQSWIQLCAIVQIEVTVSLLTFHRIILLLKNFELFPINIFIMVLATKNQNTLQNQF